MAEAVEERTRQLERLYLEGQRSSKDESLSVEGLLDALTVLHDECSKSTLRREKNIADFVQRSECTIPRGRACFPLLVNWVVGFSTGFQSREW